MEVKIINKSNNPLPEYTTAGAAGVDVRAFLEKPIALRPLERVMVPTGLFLQIPEGYEAQVRPRSGLAAKSGITVLNTPGTIDCDYRGEVKVILINLSHVEFKVNNGDRIAQIVFAKYERASFSQVDQLDETSRGDGGFGSTGKV